MKKVTSFHWCFHPQHFGQYELRPTVTFDTASRPDVELAEYAFRLTNAPDECLTENELEILKENKFKGPSLSSGDFVLVEDNTDAPTATIWQCKWIGWEQVSVSQFVAALRDRWDLGQQRKKR